MSANNSYEDVLKDASSSKEEGNLLFQFGKTYPAWIILLVTLGISVFIYFFMVETVNDEFQTLFNEAKTSVSSRIEDHYETNIEILESIAPIFKGYVVKDKFDLNASTPANANKYIYSISKVTKVPSQEYDDFIYLTRSQGYYDMRIHPEVDTDTNYIIEYIVPLENNLNRHAYDFASEPDLVNLMKKAAVSNELEMSNIYNVRPDTLGFYIFAPIFKPNLPIETPEQRYENFDGVLMVENFVPDFFDDAIGSGIATDSTIIFEIIDENTSGDRSMVYTSFNHELLKSGYTPLITDQQVIDRGGHKVDIVFYTVPGFGGEFQQYLPIIAGSISGVISIVLFGFIISVITSRQRALNLADQMTKSQRRIVEASQDIIAVLDFEGQWKTMNPASDQIFKKDSNSLLGTKIDALFFKKEDVKIFYDLLNTSLDDYTERVDVEMVDSDDKIKWVNWSFTVSVSDQLVYAIGRDVTLEKKAEEQRVIRNKQIALTERFSREASESKTNFMIGLSHNLRNSLTGIMGYLDLLKDGFYDSEEELQSYVGLAVESSEQIFNFVADSVDMTLQTGDQERLNNKKFIFREVFENVNYRLIFIENPPKANVNLSEETPDAQLYGDRNVVGETLLLIYYVLSAGQENTDININITENQFEKATELQIQSSGNPFVEKMIKIYKENSNNIVDVLDEDKEDTLFNLAEIHTNVRRLNGSIQVESFGGDEGNIIMMTLPISRTINT